MSVLNIFLAILLLGFIVVIHELGHYVVGRLCHFGIEEFSVGFGPRLAGWQRKGISYSVRAIPLGGYVRFTGEDGQAEKPSDPNAERKTLFTEQPVWQRFLTTFAGAGMNFVLAFVSILLLFSCYGYNNLPEFSEIEVGSPAETAGLLAGDVVAGVDGTPISYDQTGFNTMYEMFSGRTDDTPFTLDLLRNGEKVQVTLSKAQGEDGAWRLGVMLGVVRRVSFGNAFRESVVQFGRMSTMMLDVLRKLVFHGEGLNEVSGTVGIVNEISHNITQGFDMVLNLIAVISLNLGIMNLLPLPALDGGRLMFLLVEAVRRKPVPPEKEGLVHMIGLVCLLVLMVVLMYSDIMKIIH